MKERYDSLKKFYDEASTRNVGEFNAKCKLFLSTTNKLIQRETKKVRRKHYRGIFHEIAVLMIKAEKKFKKKNQKITYFGKLRFGFPR